MCFERWKLGFSLCRLVKVLGCHGQSLVTSSGMAKLDVTKWGRSWFPGRKLDELTQHPCRLSRREHLTCRWGRVGTPPTSASCPLLPRGNF